MTYSHIVAAVVAFLVFVASTSPLTAAESVTWKPLLEPGSGGWITSVRVSPHDRNRIVMGGDMLGIGVSTDRGDSWTPALGLPSYEIGDITWHPTNPNIVWAGTMSGPALSTDGGLNWQMKRNGFPDFAGATYAVPVERVLIAPGAPDRLIAAGGSSRSWVAPAGAQWGLVYESLDAGETWKQISAIQNEKGEGANIRSMTFAANNAQVLYAGGVGIGVRVSEDGGKTWADRSSGLPSKAVERVIAHPTKAQTLWVSLAAGAKIDGKHTPGGVFRSDDAGQTWTPLNNGLPQQSAGNPNLTSNFKGFDVSPSNPDHMIAADGSWDRAAIYTSTDGGQSWRMSATRTNVGREAHTGVQAAFVPETAYPSGVGPTVCTFDPTDENAIFTAGSEYGLRSYDGGKTWDDFTAKRVGSETDAWIGRGYSGLCSITFRFHPTDPNRSYLLAMDAGKLWESRDGMKSWVYKGSDGWPWGGGNDISIAGDHLYATAGQHGASQGILVSTDDGKTFKLKHGAARGLPDRDKGGEPKGIHANTANPREAWASVGGKLMHTTDAGESWKKLDFAEGVSWLAADPTTPGRFYLAGTRGLWKTEDGITFSRIGGPLDLGRSRISVDSKGRVLAASWRGRTAGLWRYADGKWTRLLNESHAFDAAADPTDPTRLAIATSDDPFHDKTNATGVWISADDGASWSQANAGLGMHRGTTVTFNPHNAEQLVFGSFGGGFYVANWPKAFKPQGERRYTHTADDDRLIADILADAEDAAAGAIRNGSMTRGNESPDNWTGRWVGEGKLAVRRDTTVFKSAPASLALASEGGPARGLVNQAIDLKAGEQWSVRGVVRSAGSAKINFAMQFFDDKWNSVGFEQIGFVADASEWQSFEKTLTVPAAARQSHVVLLLEGEGTAYLDDVVVKRVAEAAKATPTASAPPATGGARPPLKNGDFEGGEATPWNWQVNGNAAVSRDTEIKKEGAASLKLVSEGGDAHGLQSLDLKPGDKVRVTGFVKSQGTAKVNAFVMSFKGMGQFLRFDQLQFVQNDSDWQAFDKTVTLPAETQSVNIGVMTSGAGTAWLDDVKLFVNGTPLAAPGDKPDPKAPTETAPTKGKPNTPAWGFYPKFPKAWGQTFKTQLERTKKGDINVVFIGDSITQGWGGEGKEVWKEKFAPLKAANYGIGGDSTRQVLYRIEQGLLDGITPKLVVLKIGTNNLYSDFNSGSETEIADGIKACVEAIRAKVPGARVLLLSILPRQNNYFIGRINKINAIISKLDDGTNVHYRDIGGAFRKDDSAVKPELFQGDQLHLKPAGYVVLGEQLQPIVAELLRP